MKNNYNNSSLSFQHSEVDLSKHVFQSLEERLLYCSNVVNFRRKVQKKKLLNIDDANIKINSSIDKTNPELSHLLIEYDLEDELIKQISIPTIKNSKSKLMSFYIAHNKKIQQVNKLKNLREFNRYFGYYFDGHDAETADHRRRVGNLSKYLFDNMYLNGYFLENLLNFKFSMSNLKDNFSNILYFAAMNHDDGKIFIPFEILNKPSSLNISEFKIMKKHTIYGDILFESIPGLETSREIANFHHEKYTGDGYFGLFSEEIPIASQITSFIDVFDALTTPRIYRNGGYYSYEMAKSLLTNTFDDSFRDHKNYLKGSFNPVILNYISNKENWEKLINYHQKLR